MTDTQVQELSANERLWYGRIKKAIEDSGRGYYVSWWLRLDFGESTAKINYWLTKLVKKGLLTKKTSVYCTEYHLINQTNSK